MPSFIRHNSTQPIFSCFQLEREHVGTAHLRLEPAKKPESVIISSKRNESQDSTIAGFYLGDLNKNHDKPSKDSRFTAGFDARKLYAG